MDNELEVEHQVPYGLLTAIDFNILTETDAVKISVVEIEAPGDVTDPRLGVPNPTSQCTTCGAKKSTHCEGHFGVIRFPFTILHPYFISETAQILNKICPGCKSIRRNKVKSADSKGKKRPSNSCKYCDGSFKEYYPTMKFKVSSKDMFGKTAVIAEVQEKFSKKSGKKSSRELASDYWDIIPKDAKQDESLSKPYKRVLSHAQVYHMLKDVDPKFLKEFVLRKSSLFLNCFPVTPNYHRVAEFMQHMIFDGRTRAYKKLVDFRGSANELSTRVLDCLNISKLRADKSATKDSLNMSGSKYMKEIILAKRSDHAFRMVVVGDPNIKLSEIGIPCYIAERLQISERLNSWNWEKVSTSCNLRILEKGEIYVRRKGNLVRIRCMEELHTGDTIYRPLNDGDIILINRPPSIHQHSLIALSVKVLPINSVLSINPLICSPFRGDFDGDCLHGYVPQSVDSRVELRELVALDKQLINRQSGKNLLSLSQDSLTAAHLVLDDGVVFNRFQMQQLEMFCPFPFQVPSIAKANCSKATSPYSCFWTGKQLFSLLLPRDFDYDFPSNDVQIKKGELLSSSDGSSWLRDTEGNLVHSLVKHCQEKSLDFLYAAQEVLCEWLLTRGLSVSLSDLYLSSDSYSRENMMDEVSCGLREAEKISHIKLLMVDSNRDFLVGSDEEADKAIDLSVERMCYDKQKSAALSQLSASAFKHVFWDIQNLAFQYASKGNSLMVMLKAGSKGNLMRLVQYGMCLGLQHSLVPLSFRIPHRLSCDAWNDHKTKNISEISGRYIPYGVVENSFLTGLNPLECFVHSLTARDSSFSDNADLPGTLTRRLMFFMRDMYIAYDGTVRNAYGNHVVQFSYHIEDDSSQTDGTTDGLFGTSGADAFGAMVGEPVGSLAACALSEAAYSALDQPISALESSPLLNLKKVLECGVRRRTGEKTASLFLSKNLGRWFHGFEYGALEVQSHLERLFFSDIVSTVMIYSSPQIGGRAEKKNRWTCHFHICEEIMKRRRLKVPSIIDALYMKVPSITDALYMTCNSKEVKSKFSPLNFEITSKDCNVIDTQKEEDSTICITVTIAESSKKSSVQLDTVRDLVIPLLLKTVVKGFAEFKKVDILWKDWPDVPRYHAGPSGELYLRVYMSENCNRTIFWNSLMDNCLQIMDMIDWQRSQPDDILDLSSAYGIDVAWKYFTTSLKSSISDTGKKILPEHLLLVADCLSITGEFVALNAKGLGQQRKHANVSSAVTQACFSNPSDSFIKAAKQGVVDNLQGSLDALSWGKVPSLGTGGKFEIVYSGKGHEIDKPKDIYSLLGSSHISSRQQNIEVEPVGNYRMSDKCGARPLCGYGELAEKRRKYLEISLTKLRSWLTLNDIQKLAQELKYMLHKYPINHQLSGGDKAIAMMALSFHPRRNEKIGTGFHVQEIRVGNHPEFENARCFLMVRTDGTVEDFSYHKCVHRAYEIIAPQRAKAYQAKWLTGKT